MPDNIASTVMFSLFMGVSALAAISYFVRVIKNKRAPVKTVSAVVVDKHKIETFSKYSGTGKREKYVIIFSANGKKLSFYVSEFSYGGYKINEKGTLKYKGDRLIEFG